MSEDGKNATRRKVLAASVCVLGGAGVGAVGTVLIGSLSPPHEKLERALAAQRRIVDVSQLKPGEFVKVGIGGSRAPVMILRRSEDQLGALQRASLRALPPYCTNELDLELGWRPAI